MLPPGMRFEKKVAMKYKYIWEWYTLVSLVKCWEKIRVETWDEFISNCDPAIFSTYFERLGEVESTEANNDEEKSSKQKAIASYVEIVGKRPWPQRDEAKIHSEIDKFLQSKWE